MEQYSMEGKTQYLKHKLQSGKINWPGNVSNNQWDWGPALI